jgi:ubiquitin-protein ligase
VILVGFMQVSLIYSLLTDPITDDPPVPEIALMCLADKIKYEPTARAGLKSIMG